MAEAIEEKRRKRKVDEEGFEAGRILGVIARKDPELYQRLKSYAESHGMKMSEMIYEALLLYDEYLQFHAVDMRSLLAALRLLDHLFKRLLQLMLSLNQYFTSEFFRQQVTILNELASQQAPQAQQTQQSQQSSGKVGEIRAKLIDMVVNMVINLLSSMMNMMISMTTPQQTKPTTPAPTPTQVKIVKGKEETK